MDWTADRGTLRRTSLHPSISRRSPSDILFSDEARHADVILALGKSVIPFVRIAISIEDRSCRRFDRYDGRTIDRGEAGNDRGSVRATDDKTGQSKGGRLKSSAKQTPVAQPGGGARGKKEGRHTLIPDQERSERRRAIAANRLEKVWRDRNIIGNTKFMKRVSRGL